MGPRRHKFGWRRIFRGGCCAALALLIVLLSACTAETGPGPAKTPAAATASEAATAYAFVGKAVCTADEFVNIRAGAGTGTDKIGTLPAGKTVNVIGYDGAWVHISYGGLVGWVRSDYLGSGGNDSAKSDSGDAPIDVPMGGWATILVNPSHPLPDGFSIAVADFEGGQVDKRILTVCRRMFADAKEDGVTLRLVDAYRSYARQNELYQKKVDSYIAKGYGRKEAEKKAATITARPNTSEHQTGLALDIVTPSYTIRDKGFARTKAFKWLDAHAQDYGFTMRYRADKVSITKVIYEPWHWRFVGVQAAKAMKKSGQCYEEYLGKVD
ncbi:MAG: D-alanyl-D-alanine carboxypeptidase family protein [Christensenellales bacterium]|jgi:D-alanyl-D-alanine carboxypeptidase